MTQPENPGSELVPCNERLPVTASADIEPQWESQSGALQIRMSGAYLGRFVNSQGWNAGYKDSHEELVPDAGIVFVVSQSSAGGTYLSAKAMEGYKVEALNPNASSRRSMWVEAPDHKEAVSVDSDWGKLGSLSPSDDWTAINFGNPGTRSGLVRVTGPHEEQHYYLMGANFQGEPDSWRVEGALCEVTPNEQLELIVAPRQLSGTVIDPGILSAEVEKTMSITLQQIEALQTAFDHDTSTVRILYADQPSADAAKTYADVTLGLLLDIARQRPYVLDGSETAVDELGRQSKRITNAPSNGGYLDRLASDEENRVAYLMAVQQELSMHSATANNAHNFTSLTNQSLAILKQGLARGTSIELVGESPAISKLDELLAADQQKTAELAASRSKTLESTIFNPNWKRNNVSYEVAIPGQKVEIDLSINTPLLTPEQTQAAFYTEGHTDSGSIQNHRYYTPTIAIVDFNRTRYAVTEASAPRSGHSDYTSKREFYFLRIAEGQEDPRYGLRTQQSSFGFGGRLDKDIQVLYDPSKSGKKGYLNEIDAPITLEYDEEADRLIIVSPYMKAGVLASKDAVKAVAWQPEDKASLEQRREIRNWQKEVKAVSKETEALRARLEEQLDHQITSARVTGADIQRHRGKIEDIILRGPERSYTYNGYRGDKWHRSQTYFATVDADGNVWGEFERVRTEIGITGQPVAPGKHIIRRNPSTH